MEQTVMTGPWRMWVCPERKIVSFHPENGFHFLEFQSWELFLRRVERYTGERYRYQ